MTLQRMYLIWVLISVSIYAVVPPAFSFPLRNIGDKKKVLRHTSENRDLILCWVVQIKTNCPLLTSTEVDGGDAFRHDNESRQSSSQTRPQQTSCYWKMAEHIKVLSQEVGLEVFHTFGQFQDHFVLCHMKTGATQAASFRKPLTETSKSEALFLIHNQHANLKTSNHELFSQQKHEVEKSLLQHDEILWFSSEYVYRHHSRTAVPTQQISDLNVRTSDLIDSRTTDESNYAMLNSVDFSRDSVSLSSTAASPQDMPGLTDLNLIKSVAKNDVLGVFNISNANANFSKYFESSTPVSETEMFSVSVKTNTTENNKLNLLPSILLSKRSTDMTFNDPYYPKQWHLYNRLTQGMDINVTGVWRHNYTGRGVTVAVVDDGLEWTNPDLRANYNYQGSWDMNDDDPDPTPSNSKVSNHHGTRCAGEIAAVANNRVCGVGVAYEAKISGLRVLDGLMTDSLEADAFNMKMDINDIYSCSWGPDDDGKTVDGPHLMAAKAMKHGVDFGRRGYGSIYVLASGNGGENQDNCNFDGYANSIYTVTVGAVDDQGGMPYYAEECASMLGVTFSSGTANKRDIVTTDWTMGQANGCTEKHTGTSAAAPLAAAMVALMLQARPCLTWRDVQYLIILTGQKVDTNFAHSQTNGANLSHSHKHGFGLMNAWRLVNAARVWRTVPWLTSYTYAESDLNRVIPKGKSNALLVSHLVSEADIRGLSLFILENVQLTISLSHPCRGKIGINLTSPSGTVSVLAAPRRKDNSSDGFTDWTFTTVRCWAEKPTGNWSFSVTDFDDQDYGQGRLTKWRLTLFGTPMTSQEFQQRQDLVEAAMSGQFLSSNETIPCPPPPASNSEDIPVSDRVLKVLILSGAFCFIMALYETFEYIMCYNEEKKEMVRNMRLALQAERLTSVALGAGNSDHSSSRLLNGTALDHTTASPSMVAQQEDEEEEEDIFDITESSRLLRDPGHVSLGQLNAGVGEEFPMSVLSAK